jgi:hypothetical protein
VGDFSVIIEKSDELDILNVLAKENFQSSLCCCCIDGVDKFTFEVLDLVEVCNQSANKAKSSLS